MSKKSYQPGAAGAAEPSDSSSHSVDAKVDALDAAQATNEKNGKGKGHSNTLLYAIIVGVIAGIAAGLLFPAQFDPETGEQISDGITEIAFLGEMFLNMLFMIVVPLIVSSMIVGITSLGDIRKIGKIGRVTIIFYLTTTVVAVILGILLAVIFQPGGGNDSEFLAPIETNPSQVYLPGNASQTFKVIVPPGTEKFAFGFAGNAFDMHLVRDTDSFIRTSAETISLAAENGFNPAGQYTLTVRNTSAEAKSARLVRKFEGDTMPTIRAAPKEFTVPANDSLKFTINVPKNPKSLSLVMSDASKDVRIYGRPGQALETAGQAVFRTRGDAVQSLKLDGSSSPPLKQGTWYLLIENKSAEPRTVKLDLNLSVPGGEKSFIRPDMGLGERIWEFVKDFAHRLFPKNIVQAAVETNVLPLIIFSLVLGGVLTTLGAKGQPVILLAEGLFEAIMKLVMLIMWFAPVGIFALVATKVGGSPDLLGELQKLAAYVGVVLGGLAIHALLVLPVLLYVLTGRSPLKYAIGMGTALLTAFSTASSNATLPLTIECLIDENKVSKKSAEFVIPLGATINMDGTALYEAVAVIFMAQMLGVPLDLSMYVIISITATLAAIGAAGIPEAGTVTMVMVLLAVGLPAEAVGYILAIDWFLDRCRTSVNVWGDAVGAAVSDVHALGAKRGDPDAPVVAKSGAAA